MYRSIGELILKYSSGCRGPATRYFFFKCALQTESNNRAVFCGGLNTLLGFFSSVSGWRLRFMQVRFKHSWMQARYTYVTSYLPLARCNMLRMAQLGQNEIFDFSSLFPDATQHATCCAKTTTLSATSELSLPPVLVDVRC